jgi:hypothetical protein
MDKAIMAKPWERYQTEKSGPWDSYKQSSTSAQSMPAQREESRGMLDRAQGVAESGAAVVSGLGSSVLGGLAGTLAAANPFGNEGDGAQVSQAIQEALTYQPRGEAGQEYLQNVVTAANTPAAGYAGLYDLATGKGLDQAVSTIERSQQVGAGKVAGDRVLDATGSPLAATAAELTPDALGLILGGKGLNTIRKGGNPAPTISGIANRVDDAVNQGLGDAANAVRRKAGEIPDFPQSAKKQEISRRIQEGSKDSDLAEFRQKELQPWERMAGKKAKVENDPLAIEAIKQGFDKGVIQSVKQASKADKFKMRQMVELKKKSLLNQEEGAVNRPSNIAGKSVGDMVREVERKRVYAGSELDKIAKGLNKPVDIDGPVRNFVDDLAGDGIKLEPTPDGKMSVNFKGSAIEGERPLEIAISRIVNRMNDTAVPNAYDVHRLKQFIYNKVNYAKSKGGLAGGVEVKLKRLAESLDSTLDNQFPVYDRVNKQYAAARQAVDAIEGIADSKLDLNNPFKDNNYGTLLRRTMSNTVSKDRLMDALQQVQEVANSKGFDLLDPDNPGKFQGKTFNDNLIAQALFVDELDVMFKPQGRTSFQGQIGQAIERTGEAATSNSTLMGEGLRALGRGAEKLRGINEENAFKSIIDLLKES